MLRKLLKHEFRATGRFMWVIYAAMVLLSVGANVAFRLNQSIERVLRALSVVLLVAWVLMLVIGVVMTVVLLVKQFHRNLLTDEGYLMFTLPGTVHHLVLSKLIAAAVWLLATIVVIVLCVGIALVDNSMLREIGDVLRELIEYATASRAINGTLMVVEVLVALFVGLAGSCLQFYSAMAIGYGFTGHKAFWSVVFYFLIQFVLQILFMRVFSAVDLGSVGTTVLNLSDNQLWHLSILGSIAIEVVVGAVYYGITVLNLQKRLNLE